MTKFTPTPEQQAIVEAAVNLSDNLAVVARAGAAKTSTLVLIAEALPRTNILTLAFNKKIAEEMQQRLPSNCTSATLHSIGYLVWRGFVQGSSRLNDRKVYFALKEEIDSLGEEDKSHAYESMAEILDLIRTAKQVGYLPDSYKGHWRSHVSDAEFEASLPMEPSALQLELVKSVLITSFKAALQGEVDFDDMIYCPALCGVNWPSHDLVLVDEAQDLSPLNQYIVKKIVRKNRIIAVGDPLQAIYGFRGADTRSMQTLISMFNMTELRLTISFRCGSNIIKNAHWRAPDMKWPEWAIEGEVNRPLTWTFDDIQDGDAIICRNNAPLFSIAIKLIEEGRMPEIAGRDIASALNKIMKKLGKASTSRDAALTALEDWKGKELRRARDGAGGLIHDRAQCISTILHKTETLGEASAYLDFLLSRSGRIYLMTGHKSKGLEFDRVFFLDQSLCNKEYEQDMNLKYVIETRAKQSLTYINSDNLE